MGREGALGPPEALGRTIKGGFLEEAAPEWRPETAQKSAGRVSSSCSAPEKVTIPGGGWEDRAGCRVDEGQQGALEPAQAWAGGCEQKLGVESPAGHRADV